MHYFGLDCEMLEFFKYYTHELSSKQQLLDGFLYEYEAAQNFEVFSNISIIQGHLKGRTCTVKNLSCDTLCH